MKQEFLHQIVGNEQIDASVLLVIANGQAERLGRLVEAQLVRHFGKMAIAVIVIHKHRDRRKDIRMAITTIAFPVFATPLIVPVPRHIASYDQVQQPVVIEVDPGRRARPATAAHTGCFRNIRKGAITIVVI